jgi:uncharacterized protein with GYD domain
VGSKINTNNNMGRFEKMPKYIVLGKFAQKGIENIKDSPQRLESARELAKKLGGELKAFYYTMGQYDFVSIMKMLNNEDALKALFIIGSLGNVKTETLVAIPFMKAVEIIGEM